MNGVQKLFCIAYHKWKSLTEETKLPTLKKHKNIGNKNTSFDYQSEVVEYTSEAAHNYGESQATQFVRELIGIRIQDVECNSATLPPFISKQGMYQEYCWHNGWNVESDGRDIYPRLKESPEQLINTDK